MRFLTHLRFAFLALSISCLNLAAVSTLYGQTNTETISVYFDIDGTEMLNPRALRSKLSSYGNGVEMQVIGFADYLGDEAYNQRLAKQRARVVANYLEKQGVDRSMITSVESKGEQPFNGTVSSEGNKSDRRVDVIFYLPSRPTMEKPKEQEPEHQKSAPQQPEENVFEIDSVERSNIVLKGLSFIPGRHYPTPESMPELLKLVETMKKYPSLEIEIQGHICCSYNTTDGIDNDTGEPTLSKNRAEFVFDFLSEHRIDESRMSFIGLGSTQPKVYPERNDDDRQMNRRVEIKIVNF